MTPETTVYTPPAEPKYAQFKRHKGLLNNVNINAWKEGGIRKERADNVNAAIIDMLETYHELAEAQDEHIQFQQQCLTSQQNTIDTLTAQANHLSRLN